jgi:hypothetical protein
MSRLRERFHPPESKVHFKARSRQRAPINHDTNHSYRLSTRNRPFAVLHASPDVFIVRPKGTINGILLVSKAFRDPNIIVKAPHIVLERLFRRYLDTNEKKYKRIDHRPSATNPENRTQNLLCVRQKS